MARTIGIRLKWFQRSSSTPHFDICKSKRALAVAAGAIELERRPYVDAMRRIRSSWPKNQDGHWILAD